MPRSSPRFTSGEETLGPRTYGLLRGRFRRRGTESASCHHCPCDEDTAQHTLETCPAWARERSVLVAAVGQDLSLRAVVARMLESEEKWQAVLTFCEAVVSQKEAAERERETSADAPTIRRRLTGRRRRQFNLLMPLLDGPRTTDSGESAGR
ncbi:hypothetical protein ABMA27_014296 [Loxostege sticticalis]|uniref:Reverse transcriptase n=1 Tax=Loxostege sticticalis TaxID=481309 RepID=A0ABR3IDF8_LOXSC